MNTNIRINLQERLSSNGKITVVLGAGKKAYPNSIAIDKLDLPNIDIVTNLERGLSFLPDNSVDEIQSTSFFEHITNFDQLMIDIYRVLKPNGIINLFVPHFSNPYFYSDPTHVRHFGYYTFYYYSKKQEKLFRKVPTFYNNCDFNITSTKFIFISIYPIISRLKRIFGAICNSSVRLQEFYEGHLTNICWCYGIEVKMEAIKSPTPDT